MAAVIIHDGNSHPSAVPHTNDNKSIEVPYNASLIIVCSGKKFSTQDIIFMHS